MLVQRFAILSLVTAVLAGCLGGGRGPTEPGPEEPLVEPPFLEAVDVADDTAEPGLRLQDDGTIWLHAPGVLYKSDDNGSSFSKVSFAPGVVLGGDADLAIASDGTLYYTDLEELVAISVFTSTDGGETWIENPVASDVPLDDRQWITVGKDISPTGMGKEAAFLVYNQLATGIWLTKSTDKGLTWEPRLAFATSLYTEVDLQTIGNVEVAPDGTIYIAYTLGSAGSPLTPPLVYGYTAGVLVSKDGGLTWTRRDIHTSATNLSNLFCIIAVDPSGTVYAAWAMEKDGTANVYLSRSKDQGATWTPPMQVNQHKGSHAQPWVSAGDKPGELAVSWYQNNKTGAVDEVGGAWHVAAAYARNADTDAINWTEAIAVGSRIHKGAICVDGVLCGSGRELLDFFQVRLGGDDRVHIAYASDDKDGRHVHYVASQRALDAPAPLAQDDV